jgi:hypothetical protein
MYGQNENRSHLVLALPTAGSKESRLPGSNTNQGGE